MKFSIITVTKNNKAGLLRAIECVRSQTYKNVEHIIVDGGSTDGTVEMLRSREKEINSASVIPANEVRQESTADSGLRRNDGDSKNNSLLTTHYSLTTISETDSGIYDAINKGIRLATGDVIGLLHSDDFYADENVLEKYAEVFKLRAEGKEQSVVEAVYSDLVYIRIKPQPKADQHPTEKVKSQKSKDQIDIQSNNHSIIQPYQSGITVPNATSYSVIRYWKSHTKSVDSGSRQRRAGSSGMSTSGYQSLITDHLLKKGWMPPHPTLFIRKEIFEKYGYYRTDMKIAADYEMILRLLYKYKITTYYLLLTTYLMTIGGASNKSIKNILQKSKEDYRAMKINGINSPLLTLISKNLRKLPQFLARDLS